MADQTPIHSIILEKLKEQSLVVILLAIVTYYFYIRTEKLESMVVDCQIEFRNTLLDIISRQEGVKFEHREDLLKRPLEME
jgi:hypothetical protein